MPTEKETEIGSLISSKMGVIGVDIESAAEIFCGILCFPSKDGAASYIRDLIGGNLRKNEGDYCGNLERLSRFLYLMGVPENDCLIGMIGEWDSSFLYPPNGDQKLHDLVWSAVESPRPLTTRNSEHNGTVDARIRRCINEIQGLKEGVEFIPAWIYFSPVDAYNRCLEVLLKNFPEARD